MSGKKTTDYYVSVLSSLRCQFAISTWENVGIMCQMEWNGLVLFLGLKESKHYIKPFEKRNKIFAMKPTGKYAIFKDIFKNLPRKIKV